MTSPKVSVSVPVYNRQNYIKDAIESVLAQSFADFELIICDNCSTDSTPEVVREYARQDSRIRFYQNEKNLGVIGNMNQCLLLCRGEYIKFVFSDDKLAPNCLEVFVQVMDENPTVSLATSFTKSFGQTEHLRDAKCFPATGLIEGKKAQKSLILDSNWPGSPSSTIFRRRDLYIGLIHHFWRYWLGDLDFSMRLLGAGDAYVVPESLSCLRIHGDSESAKHGTDFRLIKERLLLANMAFNFPHVYGEYSRKERAKTHRHLLKRLAREGLSKKGIGPKIDMLKIGFSRINPNKTGFMFAVLKNITQIFSKK